MKKWIQVSTQEEHEGALRRQLKIPKGKNIPRGFLAAIKNTPVGEYAHNPSDVGTKKIKVTGKTKKRAVWAYTVGKYD
jgi:hypothetical protein